MLKPAEFIEGYAGSAAARAARGSCALFFLAVLAGFFIAMGGAVSGVASYTIGNVSAARIISGLLFPFGLALVIMTGAELFTGNCLFVIPLAEGRVTFSCVLKNLFIVYVGNFTGALALAAACVLCGPMDISGGAMAAAAVRTAAAKCSLPFSKAVVLGILCNILVCAGVMCAFCAEGAAGRTIGAFMPVSFFVICGFEHCIANMYYVPAGILAARLSRCAPLIASAGVDTQALTWSAFLLRSLLPVTIGNVIGGGAFALLIWMAHRKTAVRS